MNNRDASVPAHDEQALNQHLINQGLTAPRITPEHIDSCIASEWYIEPGKVFDGADGFHPPVPANSPLHLLTICVLVLKNGFTVTGESACASPENYDEATGRAIARRNARDKIWALEGYLLRERLHIDTTEPLRAFD